MFVIQIFQKVVQEAPKPPSRGVGVGAYDVNTELFTHADVSHTVAEHVQRVREKEIQTWIQGKMISPTIFTSLAHDCDYDDYPS